MWKAIKMIGKNIVGQQFGLLNSVCIFLKIPSLLWNEHMLCEVGIQRNTHDDVVREKVQTGGYIQISRFPQEPNLQDVYGFSYRDLCNSQIESCQQASLSES